jgi:hypothetical protein
MFIKEIRLKLQIKRLPFGKLKEFFSSSGGFERVLNYKLHLSTTKAQMLIKFLKTGKD